MSNFAKNAKNLFIFHRAMYYKLMCFDIMNKCLNRCFKFPFSLLKLRVETVCGVEGTERAFRNSVNVGVLLKRQVTKTHKKITKKSNMRCCDGVRT